MTAVPRSEAVAAAASARADQAALAALARDLARTAVPGYRLLRRRDEGYPPLLAAIPDPPAALFLRGGGDVDVLRRPAVGIVGARACSSYGASVARSLGRELAAAGAVVVSGLARGVDAEAHRGALDAGGVTVAVLGCGIDRTYPQAHARLADAITERGLLVSEYPPGVPPAPWRFPARNRIIAGLAVATVVVEARERSGALITADLALEDGRDVLAVPGEITSALSTGTNALLRAGAAVVTGAGDVLEALGLEAGTRASAHVEGDAARVLAAVADAPATADELVRATGLAARAVAAELARLELEGLVVDGGGVFRVVMPPGS